MGFKDLMQKAVKAATRIGEVSGSEFPVGTTINIQKGEDSSFSKMLFTFPNGQEYVVTRDKVKFAEVLSMGVIDIKDDSRKGQTMIYGTKYKVELTDGKVAVLTVGLGKTLYYIEHIIF